MPSDVCPHCGQPGPIPRGDHMWCSGCRQLWASEPAPQLDLLDGLAFDDGFRLE
jgi:hypothetical protein